jgi:hypothetical protein
MTTPRPASSTMSIQSIIESVDAIGVPTVRPLIASTESVTQVGMRSMKKRLR